jgi:hypothetical protein
VSLDRLAITLTAIVATLAIIGYAARGLRRMWHLMSKVNRWLDQVLGEPARDGQPGRPSLMQRVEAIETKLGGVETKLADHLDWHADPRGTPPAHPESNGVQRSRRAGGPFRP